MLLRKMVSSQAPCSQWWLAAKLGDSVTLEGLVPYALHLGVRKWVDLFPWALESNCDMEARARPPGRIFQTCRGGCYGDR